ncbi:hypothetical protein SKAU_G00155040 [Synaphobranchus kaupii]|uniref:Uncharacterized protein n=1 Tax=Synaphobranchus kaupii TaxID=118154 RepID=A0A9Q1IX26_SYNKA|nr:hypothetical protein SKAU_G00155040 [Synaphobranchus kaupii]
MIGNFLSRAQLMASRTRLRLQCNCRPATPHILMYYVRPLRASLSSSKEKSPSRPSLTSSGTTPSMLPKNKSPSL